MFNFPASSDEVYFNKAASSEDVVCYRCYRASDDLECARKAFQKAEDYFLKCGGITVAPQTTEKIILENVKSVYNSLDKFSPFRPEFRQHFGKGLPDGEVCEWFGVSARSVVRSRQTRSGPSSMDMHDFRHNLIHSMNFASSPKRNKENI